MSRVKKKTQQTGSEDVTRTLELKRRGSYIMEPRSEAEKERVKGTRSKSKGKGKERKEGIRVLTNEQLKEIEDAFNALDVGDGNPRLNTAFFKKAMDVYGLNILGYFKEDDKERIEKEIKRISGGKDSYDFNLEEFLDCMIEKQGDKDSEIEKVYNILCGNDNDTITKERLREICEKLGEKITDEELDEMIEIAHPENKDKEDVDLKEFSERVIAKTNLFN